MDTPLALAELRLVELAGTHRRVLTHHQVLDAGIGESTMDRLIRRGWMRRYSRGVYIIGPGELDALGHMRAALLSHGRDGASATTGLSTLHLYACIDWEPRNVSLLVASRRHTLDGVDAVRTRNIDGADLRIHRGILTTSVERAIVELSASTNPLRLLKHMSRARYRHCFDRGRLLEQIERCKHRGICENVRRAAAWEIRGDGGADSEYEERFDALVRSVGIDDGRCNVHVTGLWAHERVDFVWDRDQLVVEIDGPHHLDPTVQLDDARRDSALRRAGYRVIRIWWWELDENPRIALDRVRSALGR